MNAYCLEANQHFPNHQLYKCKVKSVGVIMDGHLCWNDHVEQLEDNKQTNSEKTYLYCTTEAI